MIAITADTLRNIALGGVGASVLLSLVLAMVIKSVVGKLISVAIMAAVALALYTQHDQLGLNQLRVKLRCVVQVRTVSSIR